MEQRINKALQEIDRAFGKPRTAHVYIAKNVYIFSCESDSVRGITIEHSNVRIKVKMEGIRVAVQSLKFGEKLLLHEDRIAEFLEQLPKLIKVNGEDTKTEYTDAALETLFTITSEKIFAEREINHQISLAEHKVRTKLEDEHRNHINAIIADIYTDAYYGKKNVSRGINTLDILIKKLRV